MQVAHVISSMEITEDPISIVEVCKIASGIQLIRDIGAPTVLKFCRSFEGTIFNYLSQCPKIKPSNLPPYGLWMETHWWWEVVRQQDLSSVNASVV